MTIQKFVFLLGLLLSISIIFNISRLFVYNDCVVQYLNKSNSNEYEQILACKSQATIQNFLLPGTSNIDQDWHDENIYFVGVKDSSSRIIAFASYYFANGDASKIYINRCVLYEQNSDLIIKKIVECVLHHHDVTQISLWVNGNSMLYKLLSQSGFVATLCLNNLQKLTSEKITVSDVCNFTISKLNLNDTAQVQEFAEFAGGYDFVHLFGMDAKAVQNHLQNHCPICFWVQDKYGVLCATVYAHQVSDDTIKIYALSVHPDYRKHGIATALLEYIRTWAQQKHMRTIMLSVAADNQPALCLYKKLKFEFVGKQIKMELFV